MAAMMMRAKGGMKERLPLLGEEERRRRPQQQQHENSRATTAAAAATSTTTTLRLRRRWPFSSSSTAAATTSTQRSRCVTESTTATASNSAAAETAAATNVKTTSRSNSFKNKSDGAKSQRATTLSKATSKSQRSLPANRKDQHQRYAASSSAALGVFKSSAVASQRKSRYGDGHGHDNNEGFFLPQHHNDPPAVSFSVASTTTTATASSFAQNLHPTNSHSTSASSALSFSNNTAGGFTSTTTSGSQAAGSSSSSHSCSSTSSNSHTTSLPDDEEFFATSSTWDDAVSHDSTCKIQHQENKNSSSLLKKTRYYGQAQHEEKKMEEDFFMENTTTASHATTASSLTDNDPDLRQQQQKQRRRSLGSSGKSSTRSNSPAPSNASTTLSSSAATPSPVGPRDHGDDDGFLSKTTTPWQQQRSSNGQPQQPVTINPVKALLSRPLGRHTLPVAIARKWVVEVSSPEWDADEQRWKYRILVQSRRQQQRQQQQKAEQQQNLNNSSFDEQQLQVQSSSCEDYPPPGVKQARSFTAAFTWRSLADFLWLEQALRVEFHGALLLPILSIALGKPADENLEGMPVESEKLRDWLSDTLNGIRGQGEWILPMGDHDTNSRTSSSPLPSLLHAESMEAFLYRNSGPLQEEHIPIFPVPLSPVGKNNPVTPASHATPATTDTNSLRDGNVYVGDYPPPMQQLYHSRAAAATQGQQQQQSLVQQFFHRPLDFLPLELCAGPVPEHPSTPGSSREPHHQDSHSFATLSQRFNLSHNNSITQTPQRRRLPVEMFNCSSRALSSAPSLDVMDSFAADSSVAASPRYSSNLAIHSEVVEAERDLVLNYRATALSVMEKMQGLQQAEEDIGLAWKRLAISLSNLFAYEKDVEHAKLGDLKRTRKENMPYRKVSKKIVDDCLRVMSRQKVERAVPALRALQSMLSAYVADLSAVEPSVEVYTATVRHLSLLLGDNGDDIRAENNLRGDIGLGSRPVTSWDRAKEAMRALVEKERAAKNHLVDVDVDEEEADVATLAQRKAYQQRILHHERALCNALATMCRATPIRVARMSWCYWNAEATQCAALHSAAHALRTKISVANKDSVSRMLKRHLKEEKEDHMTELALIQRMVNLGNNHKFAQPSHQHATHSTSSVDGDAQVEITNDELGEQQEKAMLRDQALLLARQRVGRWDSKLGLAIMRAIGIQDPNVRVEETTRDLRLIRKYAIGLRECLSRCIDAVDRIRAVTLNGGKVEEDDDDKDDNDDSNVSEEPKKHIGDVRKAYLVEMAKLFSCQFIDRDGLSAPKSSTPSVACLTKAGVDMSDPFGWSAVFNPDRQGTRTRLTHGRVGDLALAYLESRDHQTEWLLTSLSELLHDYYNRVETVEGYVYMECVGIQLEKYFSEKRSKALSAFEKKTDITTAINIATRKCMPKIVKELQTKLDLLGPDVSHTLVKETKEVHFESKSIKAEIHALGVRRLTRARESSTERAIALMSIWAKEEEGMATTELKSLGEAMSALERLVAQEDMGTTGYFS